MPKQLPALLRPTIQTRRALAVVAAACVVAAASGCSGRPHDVAERLRTGDLPSALTTRRPMRDVLEGRWERRVNNVAGLTDVLEFARDGSVILTFAAHEGPQRYVGTWSSIPYCGRDLGLEPKRFAILHDCVELYFDADPNAPRNARPQPLTTAPSAVRECPAPGRLQLLLWRGRLFEARISQRWLDRPSFQAIFERYFDDPGFDSFAHVEPDTPADDAPGRDGR